MAAEEASCSSAAPATATPGAPATCAPPPYRWKPGSQYILPRRDSPPQFAAAYTDSPSSRRRSLTGGGGSSPRSAEWDQPGHTDQILLGLPDRPEHAWMPCPAQAFRVRCGPNYAVNGTKVPSAEALYEVVSIDGYNCEQKTQHVARVMELPDADPADAELCLPPFLILNIMVPNYAPSLMQRRTDGPGWSMVCTCRLSDTARKQLLAGERSAAVELVRRFMHPTEGAGLRKERLKVIMGTPDPAEGGFNMMTTQLLRSYNYKPFLSKTASSFYSVPGKYFEIDLDIHTWGSAPLKGFDSIKKQMAKIMARVGAVVEAQADEEMPEQMLISNYLLYVDTPRAPQLDPQLAAYLVDGQNRSPALL